MRDFTSSLFDFFQVTFYVVMLLENILLVAVWLAGVWPKYNIMVPLLVLTSFFVGKYLKMFSLQKIKTQSFWVTCKMFNCFRYMFYGIVL